MRAVIPGWVAWVVLVSHVLVGMLVVVAWWRWGAGCGVVTMTAAVVAQVAARLGERYYRGGRGD
jgi:hypothetical protein